MLRPADHDDEALQRLRAGAAKDPVGAPTAGGTRVGPLAGARQHEEKRRPVLAVLPDADEDEAAAIADGTPYGARGVRRLQAQRQRP